MKLEERDMAKMTKRSLGLTDGYKSDHDKKELTQKLGTIEHEAGDLAEEVCESCCKHRKKMTRDELELRCAGCAMARLMELIE